MKQKIKIGDKVMLNNEQKFVIIDILTTKRKSNGEITRQIEVKPIHGGMTYKFDARKITKIEKEHKWLKLKNLSNQTRTTY